MLSDTFSLESFRRRCDRGFKSYRNFLFTALRRNMQGRYYFKEPMISFREKYAHKIYTHRFKEIALAQEAMSRKYESGILEMSSEQAQLWRECDEALEAKVFVEDPKEWKEALTRWEKRRLNQLYVLKRPERERERVPLAVAVPTPEALLPGNPGSKGASDTPQQLGLPL